MTRGCVAGATETTTVAGFVRRTVVVSRGRRAVVKLVGVLCFAAVVVGAADL